VANGSTISHPDIVRMGVVGDTECNSIQAVIAHCAYLETFNLSTVLSTHAFSPKSARNMIVQDPNVGVTSSKSVNSPTGHRVYGKVLPST